VYIVLYIYIYIYIYYIIFFYLLKYNLHKLILTMVFYIIKKLSLIINEFTHNKTGIIRCVSFYFIFIFKISY